MYMELSCPYALRLKVLVLHQKCMDLVSKVSKGNRRLVSSDTDY